MCRLLNSNQVFAAKHFQNQVEFFFKGIVVDCPLGKIQYTVCVDFQVCSSPFVHCFLCLSKQRFVCLFSLLLFSLSGQHTSFNFTKQGRISCSCYQIVHAFLPDRNENPELHDLLKSRAVGSFFMVVEG